MHKSCTKCNTTKPVTEFNYREKKKGTYQSHCRDCTKGYLKKHYRANEKYYRDKARYHTRRYEKIARRTIYELKLSNPCVECGEGDPRVLDFDHIISEDKSHNVANMVKNGYSVKSILKEVEKCQILCANCHQKKTLEENNSAFHTICKERGNNVSSDN